MEHRISVSGTAAEEESMKEKVMTCRFCGKPVMVVTWGIYRKIVVDAASVMVTSDPEGIDYVRSRHTVLTGTATGGNGDEVRRLPGGAEAFKKQRVLPAVRNHHQQGS